MVTADFRVIHHHSLKLIGNVESWIEAHIKIAEKWDGRIPGVGAGGGDWKQRARRAEAEASAAQTQVGAERLLREATAKALREERERVNARQTGDRGVHEQQELADDGARAVAGTCAAGDFCVRGGAPNRVDPATASRALGAKPPSRDGRPDDAARRSPQKL